MSLTTHLSRILAGPVAALTAACGLYEPRTDDPGVAFDRAAITLQNGVTMNGLGSNGVALNGVTLNGVTLNGVALNGVALDGVTLNGVTLGGVALGGVTLDGVTLGGVALSDVTLGGIPLGGVALSGIALDGVALGGVALDGATAQDFATALGLIVECALPAGVCVTATDLDGAPLTLCGDAGLDPGWADRPPDLYAFGAIGECVLERAEAAGHAVEHRPVAVAAFEKVLQYMVQCALPADASITILDIDGQPASYRGAIGLAPGWASGPLDGEGERRVSACLAARTNASGKTVQVSLRGLGVPLAAIERAQFAQHEGAFAANLFAARPYVNSCDVSGGIGGRTCASDPSTCGFTAMGPCASVCSPGAEPGTYAACGGEAEVISTFLALDHSVALGHRHTCVRTLAGQVACWGNNAHGQLGLGPAQDVTISEPQLVALDGGAIDSLASSYLHTCARGADGVLRCWGENAGGQLGDGTSTPRPSPTVVAALGSDVAQVSTSDENTCAVTVTGQLWCWGRNDFGQLGDGSHVGSATPRRVQAVDNAVEAAAGFHTCALDGAGAVRCWGRNDAGQVGDGTAQGRASPVLVQTDAVDLCAGDRHTCAIVAGDGPGDGQVVCWGDNRFGQLGDGTTGARAVPGPVLGLPAPATAIGCGRSHTCARLADGTAWCWGANDQGQVGIGVVSTTQPTPRQVVGLTGVTAIEVGSAYACGQLAGGTIRCWGANGDAQLGNGTTEPAAEPARMTHYSCGDAVCDPAAGETALTCAADCGACGDGACSPGERCDTCAADCGACEVSPCQVTDCAACGSRTEFVTDCTVCGQSGRGKGTTCNTCAISVCNACTVADPALCGGPGCGDGVCEAGEDCVRCAADCGACRVCAAHGEACSADADCCAGRCGGVCKT